MIENKKFITSIAPNLASILDSPFAIIASTFIIHGFSNSDIDMKEESFTQDFEKILKDTKALYTLKALDLEFKKEIKKLNLDLSTSTQKVTNKGMENKPQFIISILFISAYFLLLSAIIYIESSDTLNMQKSANSFMDDIKILIGIITAGIGQTLSFWYSKGLEQADKKESK